MEERMEKIRFSTSQIIITGPESTGKTELAKKLSKWLGWEWIPEFSRLYIENLNRPYNYSDVENIAREQILQFTKVFELNHEVIFDTGLLITKVWFDVVYGKCPQWLIEYIESQPKILHLLCNTDLPWEYDPVRENGGEMRQKLFDIYQAEMDKFKFPYEIVSGIGKARLENAKNKITSLNILQF